MNPQKCRAFVRSLCQSYSRYGVRIDYYDYPLGAVRHVDPVIACRRFMDEIQYTEWNEVDEELIRADFDAWFRATFGIRLL